MVSRIEVHSEDMEREHASFPMTLHCDDANAMMQTNRAMLEIPGEMQRRDMRSCRKCSSVMYAKGAVGRFVSCNMVQKMRLRTENQEY